MQPNKNAIAHRRGDPEESRESMKPHENPREPARIQESAKIHENPRTLEATAAAAVAMTAAAVAKAGDDPKNAQRDEIQNPSVEKEGLSSPQNGIITTEMLERKKKTRLFSAPQEI